MGPHAGGMDGAGRDVAAVAQPEGAGLVPGGERHLTIQDHVRGGVGWVWSA